MKKKSLVGWTTKWRLEHSPLSAPFRTKKDLDNSPNMLQIGYQPIRVRITIEELPLKRSKG